MKSALKYGLIGGIVMITILFLATIPFLNQYLDLSIIGASRFVIICGAIMYALNNHLKFHNLKGDYNYGMGFLIGLVTGLTSAFILGFAFYIINFIKLGIFGDPGIIWISISPLLALIIICSLIMPLIFRRKGDTKNNQVKTENKNILDADL
jgi:peptidoglycan biosynthesis protein MviN/MurJ (putative lipid II flippase)